MSAGVARPFVEANANDVAGDVGRKFDAKFYG
jgi:hypothetical protein